MFWKTAGLVLLAAVVADHNRPFVQIGAARVKLRPLTLDGFIYNEIVNQDDYRLRSTPLPPNPVIVDIGAQVGIFTTFAASVYPTARIYSYEMDDLNFAALQENTTSLRDRVMVQRAMVVGVNVPTGYTRDGFNSGGHRVGGELPTPPPITIAEILANVGGHVDLLKMDIEGSEYDVFELAVADGSIQHVDRIYGEWHNDRASELVSMLSPYFSVEIVHTADPSVGLFFATRGAV